MPKIIYFTAGAVPTTPEQAAIDAIAAFAADPYEFVVRNAAEDNYANIEAADYVAGSAPSPAYDGVSVFDPDSIPEPSVGDDQVVLTDGETTGVEPSGSYTDTVTFTISGGAITAIVLS